MLSTIAQPAANAYSCASDEELGSLARKGRVEAFDELVRRHWAGINRFLLGYLPHGSSEDVAQEAFLRAFRKIELYEEGKPFAPWLFTIARRLALNAIRGRNRRREVPLPERPVEEQSPEEPLCFGPLWQFAKERLSANAYAALRLHYAEDLPIEEVARVLDKNKIAVKVMLHRARRRLSEFSAQLKETQTT